MAQTAALLRVRHVPTAAEVALPIFVSSYEMDVSPSWHSEEVFGRMDPIFTYKNTKRKFTAIVRTPHGGESIMASSFDTWDSEIRAWITAMPNSKALNKKTAKAFYERLWTNTIPILGAAGFPVSDDTTGARTANPDIVVGYLPLLGDLYKLMYPTWELGSSAVATHGPYHYGASKQQGVGRMTGTPVLEIFLAGVAAENIFGGGASSLIFIPETFKVNKLMNEDGVAVVINDFTDFAFAANAEGYTVTLGGTILHRGSSPGFAYGADKLYFQQGRNFPFDTSDQSQFENPLAANQAATGSTGGGP